MKPEKESIVCVDNSIVFKAVYNYANPVVVELMRELILNRSCRLYTTYYNLERSKRALISKVCDTRTIIGILKLRLKESHVKRAMKIKSVSDLLEFSKDLFNELTSFIEERFEFVASFLHVHKIEFYREYLSEAISILEIREDIEDAHLLALAFRLYEEHNKPVYIWTDDEDFYRAEDLMKERVRLFRRVE